MTERRTGISRGEGGVKHFRQYFDRAAQEALLADMRRVIAAAPLYTPTMPRSGKKMSVRMTNCGSLGWVTDREIEAGRIAITRFIKRSGRIWIRMFPDKPITKKPQETRMGKGKGAPEQWVMVVKPGRILYEMEGVPEKDAREALRLAAHKLSIKTKFVKRFEAEVA